MSAVGLQAQALSAVALAHSGYATRALAAAAVIPNNAGFIRVSGNLAAGDGGAADFYPVGANPNDGVGFQSADGQWWAYAPLLGQMVNPVAFSGALSGTVATRTTAWQNAINFAVTGGFWKVIVPPGTTTLNSLNVLSGSVPLFVGAGSGRSKIQHADGDANPLFHQAYSGDGNLIYAGWEGMSLLAGNQTTALIYFEGQIDNNIKFYDLQFHGKTGAATTDGISCLDYLNWNLSNIRFDGIQGWAFKVRNANVYPHSHFSCDQFTYDSGTLGASGMFYMDASLNAGEKGVVSFTNARIEVNSSLTTSKPARSLIRILQNHTYVDGNPAQVFVDLKNLDIDASGGRLDTRFITTDYRNIGITVTNVSHYGMFQFYNNDNYDAVPINCSSNATNHIDFYSNFNQLVDTPLQYRTNGVLGMLASSYDSDSNFTTNGFLAAGDFAYNRKPWAASGHTGRVFAQKAVQSALGTKALVSGLALISGKTGAITSGSNLLTMSGAFTTGKAVPGMSITVAGAGAAAANLEAVVNDIDFTTPSAPVLTLSVNAGTTVTVAAVTVTQAEIMSVPMVWLSNGVPTDTHNQYRVGDIAVNTGFNGTSSVVIEWTCTGENTPGSSAGTWRAAKWFTNKGATGSRPTGAANTQGITYLDTTLAAAGKIIWYTGSGWVDATGTAA